MTRLLTAADDARLRELERKVHDPRARPGVMRLPVAASFAQWEAVAAPHMAKLLTDSRLEDDVPAVAKKHKRRE